MATVAELNSRITVKVYTTTQDETTGDISSALTASWTKWAKVEESSGSRYLDNAAVAYSESYTITMRYETSRKTLEKYCMEFKGQELKIHSVTKQYEGLAWWEVVTAYTQK